MKALPIPTHAPAPAGLGLTRRACLGAAAAALWGGPAHAGHEDWGPLSPRRPVPDLRVQLHNGAVHQLPAYLKGHTTALQLIFTTCSALCPLQGAVFAQLQDLMKPAAGAARLLSMTIDPLNDDPKALSAWLARFGAGPAWAAATPQPRHADAMLEFLQGRSAGADRHTAQVYLIDAQARLAFRFADLAPARVIARDMFTLMQRDASAR